MSTAHKCDRCKALYEGALRNVSVEYHVTVEVKGDGDVSQGCEADLCPGCSEAFLVFIDHEEGT